MTLSARMNALIWRARWDTQELVDTTSTIMQQIFEYLWLYFPLGMIGFYRWSVWGFKRICAQRYEPIQIGVPTYYSSLSIVTPVYNEDPALFKKDFRIVGGKLSG